MPRVHTSNVDRSYKRRYLYTKIVKKLKLSRRNYIRRRLGDYLVLLANATTKAESLLHSLKPTTRAIDFYMNANKTKFLNFKQEVTMSTL